MSQPLIQPHKKLFIDKQVQRVEETHEFIKGSDVGFDIDEIKATPTEELKTIRRSIFEYLKSTKQKKRNANFKEAFLRINEELEERKRVPSNVKYNEAMISLGVCPEKRIDYINKKRHLANKELFNDDNKKIEIDVPIFLNDNVKEDNKDKKEYESDEDNKKIYKNFFSFMSNSDFDLGEEDYSTFKIKKADPVEQAMKNFEIKKQIFGEPLKEEPLFSLESDSENDKF